MNKLFFLFFSSLSFFVCNRVCAQSPIMGEAIVFDYDAAGQRVLRHWEPSIQINKIGVPDTGSGDTTNGTIDQNNVVIKAYPNPTDNFITIENSSWKENDYAFVRLFDIAGKFITSKEFRIAKGNIQFYDISPGIYQLHYYLNGQLACSWKIVKR